MPKHAKFSVTKLDLTLPSNQALVLQWIEKPEVCGLFLTPPRGTISAARSIPLRPDDPGPQPLRSVLEPDGLSDVPMNQLEKVSLANILYDFTATVYDLCSQLGKPCIVANPMNSLFWFVTPWIERKFVWCDFIADHDACMYGSVRPTHTRLCANFPEVLQISLKCDHTHKHEAWGCNMKNGQKRFANCLEVHYPQGLCQAIAQVYLLHFARQGWTFSESLLSNASAQAFSGKQPTSAKLPPLVPEFKTRFSAIFCDNQCLWPILQPPWSSTKLLHQFKLGDSEMEQGIESVRACCDAHSVSCNLSESEFSACKEFANKNLNCLEVRLFGTFWDPEEFVCEASKTKHPFAVEQVLPDPLITAVAFNLKHSAAEVAEHRLNFVKLWTRRALQLSEDEKKLKAQMDAKVAVAVRQKRILLFEAMLKALDFPDVNVTQELKEGAMLTGEVPKTGMLPPKFVPAISSVPELLKRSAMVRKASLHASLSSGDSEIDRVVWEKTMEEVHCQWLNGPLSPETVAESTPLTKRFGLKQRHGKVRLIDDFSESGINSCVTSCESPSLHTVDVAGALLAHWFASCQECNLPSELETRTFDLTSAYRQIALHPSARELAVLKVFNPVSRKNCLFRANVLPFGAARSVHSFLRLARALWWIGCKGAWLMWSSFYDDYISFSQPCLAKNSEQTIVSIFNLTGWLFAQEGRKCQHYGPSCEALGVLFDLSNSVRGVAFIRNTPARVEELVADIRKVAEAPCLGSKQAQRLRGRMQFAESQLFGRTAKRCFKVLSDFAECKRTKLFEKDRLFLDCFCKMLEHGPPREVSFLSARHLLIFTDACYEPVISEWVCGLGGVAIDVCSGERMFFPACLSEAQRKLLGEGTKRQIIFEAETLAAVVACKLWKNQMSSRRCTLFVDNEATKFSLVKGSSDNALVDKLAELFVTDESEQHCLLWISRVPSKSNIADEPSRNELQKFVANYLNHSNLVPNILDAVLSQV